MILLSQKTQKEKDSKDFFNEFFKKVEKCSKDPTSECIEKNEFLKILRLSKNLTNFPTMEEISEIGLCVFDQNVKNEQQKAIKIKWNEKEKKILIWGVYYHLIIHHRKLEEMVLSII